MKKVQILLLGLLAPCFAWADPVSDDRGLDAYRPELYDSLMWQRDSRANQSFFDAFFTDMVNIDSASVDLSQALPDSIYAARLKAILSPIALPFNDIVKRYLVVYTQSRKETVRLVLGRAQCYFPMIEDELIRTGLPVELRMLPVIESALTPTAVSRAGAAGLWQFMPSTGKLYGLEVTSFVDQRRDPVAATAAACRMLKELYNVYKDWTLALAAYNCGPGNVNKAMKRAGGNAKTFWDIYEFLPRETRGYVPSFVAATYAYTYYRQHGLEPRPAPLPLAVDTVTISRLTHFEQIASTLELPIETLRALNPQYKMDIIPALDKKYSLVLPGRDALRYIEQQAVIEAKDTVYLAQYIKPAGSGEVRAQQFQISSITHRVKSGEVLGSIARKYGVTVSQIMKWNNLKSANKLSVGQRLEIYQ